MKSPTVADTIDGLIEQLKDQDYRLSKAAAERLTELADPASIPALTEILKGDYTCNCLAADILFELRGSEAVPDLLEAMAYPPWWDDQDGMATIVGDCFAAAGKAASPKLVAALHDPDPKIRREAAWGLERIKDMDAIPDLISALNSDPDEGVRKSAAITLSSYKHTPEFHAAILPAVNPDGQRLVSEILAAQEAYQQRREDWLRHRKYEPFIRAVVVGLVFAALLAIAIIGKMK